MKQGVVASYIHSAVAPGLGRIGVLVALESTGDAAKAGRNRQADRHAYRRQPIPQFLTIASVDPAAVARERAVLTEQAATSGKPPAVIEKMVDGRIRKYYEEVVLLEQVFVIDGESKVSKIVENAAQAVGAPVTLTEFVRFALGEGIQKETKDFAAEVAAQLGSNA